MEREAFVATALKYLGYPATRYKGADTGNTEFGFDCSGFISWLLNTCGYAFPVPRHCNEFFDSFGIRIDDQFREAGDLVFFSFRSKGQYPDHMGILISRDEFIHSPGKDGKVICVDKLMQKTITPDSQAAQIYSVNPIGFKRITIAHGRWNQPFLTEKGYVPNLQR